MKLAELWHGLDHGGVGGRALLGPREGFLTLHLLEPEVGILVRGDADGRCEQSDQERDRELVAHGFFLPDVDTAMTVAGCLRGILTEAHLRSYEF